MVSHTTLHTTLSIIRDVRWKKRKGTADAEVRFASDTITSGADQRTDATRFSPEKHARNRVQSGEPKDHPCLYARPFYERRIRPNCSVTLWVDCLRTALPVAEVPPRLPARLCRLEGAASCLLLDQRARVEVLRVLQDPNVFLDTEMAMGSQE